MLSSLTNISFAAYPQETANYAQVSNEQSPWLIRVRGIVIDPDVDSSTITPVLGGKINDISHETAGELDFNYFFTPYVSTELILTTAQHSVKAKNTIRGKVDLGSVALLPPTLTLVYHFMPANRMSPYVGAGINYTHFYNVDDGPTATNIDYDDSWGPALQAGVDYAINEHWSVNADIKKLYIESDVSLRAPVTASTMKTDVEINPMIYGIGVGYRF